MNEEYLGVDLAQYQLGQANSFAGSMSAADLGELEKAMYAGELTGRSLEGITDQPGATLKVESLENTLKRLTFKESDIVLWKKLPKLPAYNTVEEYNQLVEYGADNYSFTNEGELPEEDDSTHVRRSQLVKFMGVTRIISHPMQLVNTMIGNVVQQQIEHGTLKLLRDADRAIIYADSDFIPQEFNGLYKQQLEAFGGNLQTYLASGSMVDLRGKALSEDVIEDAALTIIENHGEGSLFMAPPKVLSDFVKRFHEFKMIQPNTPALTNGIMGQQVNQFMSQFGALDLGYDKFMKKPVSKTLASTATNPKAPVAPVADAVTPKAPVGDALGRFLTDFDGDYYYAVSAVNRYGESGLTNLATGALPNAKVTVAAAEAVDLKFTDGGGAVPATGYIVYRSTLGEVSATAAGVKFYPIFKVTKAQLAAGYDGGAATLARDRNRVIPNTEKCFLIEPTTEVWSFKQLAPLMKMDLATISPATRFMILLYGTPILYAPKKMVVLDNIGGDFS